MKKLLTLLLMVGLVQGSLLLGSNDIWLRWYYGFPNLEKYSPNSEITRKCTEISRPWNMLYNGLTINGASDSFACGDLDREFVHFQKKFLKDVRGKKSMNEDDNNPFTQIVESVNGIIEKREFCLKYLRDHSFEHQTAISKVLYHEYKELDPTVTRELNDFQNALRKSIEDL